MIKIYENSFTKCLFERMNTVTYTLILDIICEQQSSPEIENMWNGVGRHYFSVGTLRDISQAVN